MKLIVGIGELAISDRVEDSVKTFALASCVAVTAYSEVRKVAGMLHIALPEPADAADIKLRPCYFATTGLPILIHKMCKEYGCLKGELKISLYGGADSVKSDDVFNIGKRNITAVRNTLADMNLRAYLTEVGGTLSRTLELDVATGRITVFTHSITI